MNNKQADEYLKKLYGQAVNADDFIGHKVYIKKDTVARIATKGAPLHKFSKDDYVGILYSWLDNRSGANKSLPKKYLAMFNPSQDSETDTATSLLLLPNETTLYRLNKISGYSFFIPLEDVYFPDFAEVAQNKADKVDRIEESEKAPTDFSSWVSDELKTVLKWVLVLVGLGLLINFALQKVSK